MAPTKANDAFVWQQFTNLGRPNPKKSKRYRCRHCQKDFAATSVGRPKEHLAVCEKWQAMQQQERQVRDDAGYLPSYSEAIQKKITEVGIQHISRDESHSFAYDAAAAIIAGGRPFSLFESRRWRYFFTRIKPGWKPPSRAVITRILPDFYQELRDEVCKRISSSECVITRWGSQYNSFFSLLRSRDPARDWSIRKDVRDELRSQDCPVLLPEAIRIIKDNSFWLKLETVIAVLKPVNEFQHASEADGAGIAYVVNRWLQIKHKWAEMRGADQFPDIPWDDIDAIFTARLDKQTYDIHWIADALRPDTTGPNSKRPPSVFARVQEYLRKQLKNDNEYHRALSEFTHFRMRTGGPDGLFNKHSAVYDDGFKPAMAWQCLLNQGSILASVAVKVMNTLANSVPSERSFSAISFIHTKARNRLTPMHDDMQAFIFMNDRVLDRLKDQKYAHKKRWADLEEKDWLELEDSYLELFVNAHGKKVWMDGAMAAINGDFEWEGVLQSTGDILYVGIEVESEV
ncbi:transposase [Metarhizium robertsii ARSEF 23]|uniref:Transposase n=1 Tax=Metarhizium robertsii (strain ARSEF 23 / ATCC MYA-3075) TaxID=655844 RepID=E9EJT9_METRA|nr:transposase [Metarhizium robertsii ARSEF 23]EFZ03824.2 transposase [Metarhizium robertsii ARSEF 23]